MSALDKPRKSGSLGWWRLFFEGDNGDYSLRAIMEFCLGWKGLGGTGCHDRLPTSALTACL